MAIRPRGSDQWHWFEVNQLGESRDNFMQKRLQLVDMADPENPQLHAKIDYTGYRPEYAINKDFEADDYTYWSDRSTPLMHRRTGQYMLFDPSDYHIAPPKSTVNLMQSTRAGRLKAMEGLTMANRDVIMNRMPPLDPSGDLSKHSISLSNRLKQGGVVTSEVREDPSNNYDFLDRGGYTIHPRQLGDRVSPERVDIARSDLQDVMGTLRSARQERKQQKLTADMTDQERIAATGQLSLDIPNPPKKED